MNSKRVLIFSLAYYPHVGGAEVAIKEITDRIPDIEFDMITLRLDQVAAFEEQIGNVMVYRIAGSKNLFPFKAVSLALRMHKARAYDATWSMMANWAGFAGLFFKMMRPDVPFILTLQEGDSFEYIKKKIGILSPIFKKIFRKADRITVISNYLGDWAKSMGAKAPITLIPNGVDFNLFSQSIGDEKRKTIRDSLGVSDTETLLVTASRLVAKNAVADIIYALEYLPSEYKLLVLGSGVEEQTLRKLATSLGKEKQVIWNGFTEHEKLPAFLQSSDIFIRPSLSEGMGNSFIEAMAAGIPVIATPVGGIVDFLKNEETGLFCEVKDPKSIAKQVEILVKNPDLKGKLVTNAKEMVRERYEWGLIAERMKNNVFYSTVTL